MIWGISVLWIRLASRKGFPVALEDESKTHIWELLCKNDDITMYVSQEPKPPLYLYNRFELLDLTQPELELVCEPVSNHQSQLCLINICFKLKTCFTLTRKFCPIFIQLLLTELLMTK